MPHEISVKVADIST